MSTSASSEYSRAGAPAPRLPVPPYAAPAFAGAAEDRAEAVAQRTAPYVPAVWRQALGIPSVEMTTVPETVVTAATPTTKVPPYHSLRPTPMGVPAIRPPLYIPSFPTPGNEAAVEDEGVIEPQLLTTAEFPVPAEAAGASPAGDIEALPWIDAFLAATPAAPVAAVPEVLAESEVTIGTTPVFATPPALPAIDEQTLVGESDIVGDAMAQDVENAAVVEVPAVAETAEDRDADPVPAVDEWPLDEAATEFRAFTSQLEQTESELTIPDTGAAPMASAPLPAWGDDDLMDIMPIRHSGRTPLSTAAIQPTDAELWSDRAQKAQEEVQVIRAMASAQLAAQAVTPPAPEASAEEAAHALELLAQRVRAGDLMLPSYDPRMGEPAALVAALAALLGVRLR